MDAILYQVLGDPHPEAVLLVSENKIHRGYRDAKGRFTLEQCNLSKANEAGNLVEYSPENSIGVSADDLDRCEHCF